LAELIEVVFVSNGEKYNFSIVGVQFIEPALGVFDSIVLRDLCSLS
jgi:hypothetical protein